MAHTYQRETPKGSFSTMLMELAQSTRKMEPFMPTLRQPKDTDGITFPILKCLSLQDSIEQASKWNPTFTGIIATVKGVIEKELRSFYLVMYKWTEGEKEFVTPQHGNAKKPTSSSYFRRDPEVFNTINNLLDRGMSTDKIYSQMAHKNTNTVSQTVCNPKMIAKQQYNNKVSSGTSTAAEYSEAESLISSLHSIPILNRLHSQKNNIFL